MPAARQNARKASTSVNISQKRPAWPALDQLVPSDDLHLEKPYPNQIATVSNLFTRSLCEKYVSFLSKLPLSKTVGIPKEGDAVRVNDRYQVNDPEFAQLLWEQTALKQLILQSCAGEEVQPETTLQDMWGGEVLGLNPNIRVYRYGPGQFFDKHYDDSNIVKHPSGAMAYTTWTLLIYLSCASNGCYGGETVFYPEPSVSVLDAKKKNIRNKTEPIIVRPKTGMALLHKHGRGCMLHEGREVTQGEKWVIRSDICVKR